MLIILKIYQNLNQNINSYSNLSIKLTTSFRAELNTYSHIFQNKLDDVVNTINNLNE